MVDGRVLSVEISRVTGNYATVEIIIDITGSKYDYASALPATPAPEPPLIPALVTHVRDGDTIEVNRRPIRLNGLTCGERGTLLGNQATAAMRELVAGRVSLTSLCQQPLTLGKELGVLYFLVNCGALIRFVFGDLKE